MPALAACATGGQGGGAGQASERLGPSGYMFKQPVRLTYWKSLEGPRHDAQVKITDDFNASRSDVQVTLEHVGVYAQAAEKLTAVLAANTPPDVMMLTVDTFMPGFARLGAAAPGRLHQGRQERQIETYVPRVYQERDGQRQALSALPLARSTPCSTSTRTTSVRRAARDGAGHVGPAAGRGAKLTRAGVMGADSADGSSWRCRWRGTGGRSRCHLGVRGRLSDDKFAPTVTQNETVQAMQFLQDLVQRHRVARAYRTVGPSSTAFQQGQLSFLVESTAVLTQTEERTSARVGAAFMPMQKQRAVPGGGAGLSIINSIPVEKKEAGWEYMKFFTSTPNTVYFSKMTGYMVVRTDAEKNPEFQQYLKDRQTPGSPSTRCSTCAPRTPSARPPAPRRRSRTPSAR